MFIGFYWEARAILNIIKEDNKNIMAAIFGIMIFAVAGFNTIELFFPNSSLRVALASVCVFCILVIPNLKIFLTKDVSYFKKLVGIFYLFFLLLLLPRAVYAMFHSIDVLTNFFIQTLTFLSLVLLMIFSLSAYLLLMKENTDRLINEMATTDALTGLFNRRYFMDAAERVFERHRTDKGSLAVIFLDIDHFKSINDTYGHGFGDTVLRHMGEVIINSLRTFDLSCRYGGEEFVILLPNSSLNTAGKVADRIMGSVKTLYFTQHPNFKFTISGGIRTGAPDDSHSLEQFLKQADDAMYEAKNNGRNRIVEFNDSEEAAAAL